MTGPRVLPDYFGPTGDDIAGAFARQGARKRQSGIDKQNADEAAQRLETEKYDLQHRRGIDPLEDAIRRAAARERGIRGPGEQDQPEQPTAPGREALPPMEALPGMDPGFTIPGSQSNTDPGFTAPPGAAGARPGLDPGFSRPPQGASIYDTSPVQGTAHALPGAFNPTTGTHNPADIDLGGGYSMPSSMTPEGRRARDAKELADAHIPGITPELAMYLADHPEHIAPFIQRAYGRAGSRWEPQSEQEALDYEGKLAGLRRRELQPKGELTMEQALAQVDEAYSTRDPVSNQITSSRLNMPTRMRVAREMMQGNYSHLPQSGKFGTAPLDRGLGGATSKRHITSDQAEYLKSKGTFDANRYIVDPD